jgi:PAS domain-containing protein
VAATRQKHLVLILAREFASNLATGTLITDDRGWLVYYNEAAEEFFGISFAEAGEMPLEDWSNRYSPRSRETDEPLPLEERPTGIALTERRAAHGSFRTTGIDGVVREVEVTAFPLFAHADELVGTVTFFWRT